MASIVRSTRYLARTLDGTVVAEHLRRDRSDGSKRVSWRRPGFPPELGLAGLSVRDVPLYGTERLAHRPVGWTVLVCFSEDTEILTRRGWVLLPDLEDSDEVAQWDDGSVSFVRPRARQQFRFSGEAVHFKAEWSDLIVTPDHRMLVRRPRCRDKVVRADEVKVGMALPVTGVLGDAHAGGPSEPQVRLLAAYLADGRCIPGRTAGRGQLTWNLKKERKCTRLRALLSGAGVPWQEHHYPSTPGWTHFTVRKSDAEWLVDLAPQKLWTLESLGWSTDIRRSALEELAHWDGDRFNEGSWRFFTAERQNAEVVSALAAVTGIACTVRVDSRPNRPEQRDQYVVNLSTRQWRTFGHAPARVPYDGTVYCCTVPSGFLVVRRNGKTVVAGNCEGEKAAEAVWSLGFEAVGTMTGAATCPGEDALAVLLPFDVVVWPDHDEQGARHMARVVAGLSRLGGSARRLVWATAREKGDDAADFVARGGTADLLWLLVDAAEAWHPDRPERPRLRTVDRRASADRVERARAHLADVVEAQLGPPARVDARSLWWPCPFHPERTPSFKVDRREPFFRCFGCHAAGDVFTFLARRGQASFTAALSELAPPEIRRRPVLGAVLPG